jgi:outer membrane lipoprotein-sorting protein
MKKYISILLIALLTLPVAAQQSQTQATGILDKAAASFKQAGAIMAEFNITLTSNGKQDHAASGSITIKGEKFMIDMPDTQTWFDGTTQWTYVAANEEVNVSNPSPEEFQLINPYTFIYMYKQGYNCGMGNTTAFKGKAVWEVILTAQRPAQDLQRITLYLDKRTHTPLYIQTKPRRGQDALTEITVTHYTTGLRTADSAFVFDPKQYPHAEVIDLR